METFKTTVRVSSKVPAFVPLVSLMAGMHASDHVAHYQPNYVDSTVAVSYAPPELSTVPAEDESVLGVKLSPQEWTSKMEKRFHKLSRLEALGSISPEEMFELEELSRDRRTLLCPRTSDEVIREIKSRELTKQLQAALSAYVKFQSQG